MKYAHGIVSEYLAEDLSQKLAQHLNISDEIDSKKRKLDSPKNVTNEKKLKRDSFEESPLKAKTKNLLSKPEKVSYFIVIITNNKYQFATKIYQQFFSILRLQHICFYLQL